MKIGLIGAGNMARALAVGWGEPVLVADADAERARALAAEVGGEALDANAYVADRADVVVLCHKPAQLDEVAKDLEGRAEAVVSILGAVSLDDLRAAYPGTPVFRFIPSVTAEVRTGALGYAEQPDADPELERRVLELFGRLGTVVALPESLIDVAMGLMSCTPAEFAVVAEALIDAGVRHGMQQDVASELVVAALEGTAVLLRERDNDTLAVRRSVTSPGGSTARALRALDDAGVRAALHDALDAVLDTRRR